MSAERLTGLVKWFNPTKGFGFIKIDGAPEGSKDLFVHASECEKSGVTIDQDDKVSFVVMEAKKGPVATQIKRI